MGDTEPEFIVSRDKLESFLPLLGAEVDEEGFIRDSETGELFESSEGEVLSIDEIGYLASGDDQKIIPVRNNFSSVVSELSDREFRE